MSTDPHPGTPDRLVALWRNLVLRSPGWAAGQLREFLDSSHRPAGPIAADLQVLVAEALHRNHALVDAFDASVEAARTAADLEPPDWQRLTTALIIHTDIVVCAGDDRAVAAATDALTLVADLDEPDPDRHALARALHAVAVYHHEDGEEGHRELALIRATSADTPIGAVLAAAGVAMADGLQGSGPHQRPAGTPPPLRGGVLQPHLDAPATDELAYRVRAWPANRPAGYAADPGPRQP
ncbi:hypothetical protein DMB66_32825 [Actinoplanes sp. ATCC 53533]|uniref:hypothetical protein n=1 Tax=Actinoplanes sp. ATCC 53533 TaxID=1288362 RepID=UPI000F7AB1E0|nr:hypothetical protein [Actinoplanes sp. ATCC 53533]RSM56806.1 hypothetical protein DMB66_32825 [Actinoplanes sp. ATCC 53533]